MRNVSNNSGRLHIRIYTIYFITYSFTFEKVFIFDVFQQHKIKVKIHLLPNYP